jgi:hypothetical protein
MMEKRSEASSPSSMDQWTGGLDAGLFDPGDCWEWSEDPASLKFRE